MKKLYIIHGYGATPADHWFPWLGEQARAHGLDVHIPALPQPAAPEFTAWQQALAHTIGAPTADDHFIAHSLGTISLLHYLSTVKPTRIASLTLVSGFTTRLPDLPHIDGYNLDAYADQARIDLPAIAAMTPHITSIISSNDPVVAPAESLKLAHTLHSRIITIPDGGHLLGRHGFRELPAAWQSIQDAI